jgi:hypothetical protein
VRVTTQKGIQILDAAKIRADGDILDGATMLLSLVGSIPRALGLLPLNQVGSGGQVNVHIGAAQFLDGHTDTPTRMGPAQSV